MFNRERFLLKLVAAILLIQLALYGLGAGVCAYRYASSSSTAGLSEGACRPLREGLDAAVETALNVLLALLGAGALAMGPRTENKKRPIAQEPQAQEPQAQEPQAQEPEAQEPETQRPQAHRP